MEKRKWDRDEVKICSIMHWCEHMKQGGYCQTWTNSSKGEIVMIMTGIYRKVRRNFEDQKTDICKELCIVFVDFYSTNDKN